MNKNAPGPSPVSGQDAVRTFYDHFFSAGGKDYAPHTNLRIEKAIRRILPLVRPDSVVLELGCGTGLIAEQIAALAHSGSVWACDISDHAIAVAKGRTKAPNLQFRVLDLATRFEEVISWLPKPVDLVVMVDVLEHLALSNHEIFFRQLARVLHDDSVVVLTFPSPEYQRHLRLHNPRELQIIDEIVELPHLHDVVTQNGFLIKEYSLEDVWLPNQYAHCILKRNLPIAPGADEIAIAVQEISKVIPASEKFILVDQDEWSGRLPENGNTFPFLERDGVYWGPPADDETAIRELQRLRNLGAKYLVFGSPAFWWLKHYAGFHAFLQSHHCVVFQNDRLIVFQLTVPPST
jgi:trans-aconitate 2-methyltransferase